MIPSHLVELLRSATRVAVLTGAGVSAESGIPTFREALTGLWATYRPEALATMAGFRRDPDLVWGWYRTRREAVAAAQPNPGHRALAQLATRVPTTLITQNVDGLHRRAGSPDVIELHGNIMRVKCADCERPVEPAPTEERVPRCDRCGGMLRPDVVWFGELLPAEAMERAHAAAADCDLFISVGTSNLVEPAASLPWLAARRGTPVVVVNTTAEGQRSGPTIHHLLGLAGIVLPSWIEAAWPPST